MCKGHRRLAKGALRHHAPYEPMAFPASGAEIGHVRLIEGQALRHLRVDRSLGRRSAPHVHDQPPFIHNPHQHMGGELFPSCDEMGQILSFDGVFDRARLRFLVCLALRPLTPCRHALWRRRTGIYPL